MSVEVRGAQCIHSELERGHATPSSLTISPSRPAWGMVRKLRRKLVAYIEVKTQLGRYGSQACKIMIGGLPTRHLAIVAGGAVQHGEEKPQLAGQTDFLSVTLRGNVVLRSRDKGAMKYLGWTVPTIPNRKGL